MIEDELLKWRFKAGSRAALARIYEKYADYLLTVATGLLADRHAAEDVLHDVFVRFAASAPTFRLRGSLRGFLAASVLNRARDRLRAERRGPGRLGDDDPTDVAAEVPVDQMISSERSEQLARALGRLPEEQREVVVLRLIAGLRFPRIAAIQDASVNTVQGRYRYGLQKLRMTLDGTQRDHATR